MKNVKQNPNMDSHDSNFALLNYASSSENFENNNEESYSSVIMKSIDWTDWLEIMINVGLGLFAIKFKRKRIPKKKKKKAVISHIQLNL